jgi:twitching motility protein PilT
MNQPDTWHMKDLFALALARQASDLHLKAGQPPVLRIDGEIRFTEFATLGAEEVVALAMEVMSERVRREFDQTGSVDFSHMLETGDRFRIDVYRQRGYTSLSARRVTRRIPTFQDLHLPENVLSQVCEARQGLVIFCGITGCGKSTSIATCLNYINQRRRCHIVTIEDPIEFLFEDGKAFINQREVGTDVPTFDLALRHLMREDPDVVLVGEMRDADTCESVLRAAETGHLVFTTLHSSSAPGAITRLLDLFPAVDHPLIRQTLASNLVAVICQKLIAGLRPDVPRVPALEVMLALPGVRQAIRDGDDKRLGDLVSAEADLGMYDFTQDLARLVREQWVELKTAYEVAPSPEALKMAIRGIDVKRGTLR